MAEPLALLLDDGVIDEVYTRLKSGKEADIYLVRHAGEVVAAKIYKERNARNFKNNAAYKEGRRVRNTRTQRAMDKGSRFGQAAAEEAWKAKESEALARLHAAGVRVPKPVMFYEGVLLMETILDANGRPAPRLIDAVIPREKAAEWYADLRSQVVKMLACDLIHGDLSPYNVLLAWNGPTVIDFPQVIGAAHNSQAERFFERDFETIRRFFASVDPGINAHAGDVKEIWRTFVRRELTPDFVPTGKVPPAPHAGHERRHERRDDRRPERPHERREPHGAPRPEHAKPHGQPERQGERRPGGGHPDRTEPQRGHGHPHGQPQRPRDDRPAQGQGQGLGRQEHRRGPQGQPAHPQRQGQGQPGQQRHGQGQPGPQRQGQGQPGPQRQGQGQQGPQRQGQPQRPGQQPQRHGQPQKRSSNPEVTLIQRIFGSPGKGRGGGGHGGPHGGHGRRKP